MFVYLFLPQLRFASLRVCVCVYCAYVYVCVSVCLTAAVNVARKQQRQQQQQKGKLPTLPRCLLRRRAAAKVYEKHTENTQKQQQKKQQPEQETKQQQQETETARTTREDPSRGSRTYIHMYISKEPVEYNISALFSTAASALIYGLLSTSSSSASLSVLPLILRRSLWILHFI